MQIDRLGVAPGSDHLSGTPAPLDGVEVLNRGEWDAAPPVSQPVGRSAMVRGLLTMLFVCLSLLGQGERARVDPRFLSPSATLNTYWNAMRTGDVAGAWECFVEGRHDMPLPGMIWFLPPTNDLSLAAFRSLPVTRGRTLVSYEVRYRVAGSSDLRSFRTADELVRLHGEWRISRPLGEASMPAWQPEGRPVDS